MRNIRFLKHFKIYVEGIEFLLENFVAKRWVWKLPLFGLLSVVCAGLLFYKIFQHFPSHVAIAQENPPSGQMPPAATPSSNTLPLKEPAKEASPAPNSSKLPEAPASTPSAEGEGTSLTEGTSESSGETNPEANKKIFNPMNLTTKEIQVLEMLAQRRQELEDKDKKIGLRMALLQASEQRIDQKIETLQNLKNAIDKLLKKYDVQEQENFKALARIYEKMKPKEAARILSELDMPILLNVMSYMKDLKSSQIIAYMDTARARDVTMALARERRLRDATQSALDNMTKPAEALASQ